jgi:hypothetical protein
LAALANDSPLVKVADAGISLGGTKEKAEMHVNKIKDIELERLDKFHVSNPDMFLPSDISLSVDEMLGPNKDKHDMHDECDSHSSVEGEDCHDSHISDEYDDGHAWTEVCRKKSSRKKLKFK